MNPVLWILGCGVGMMIFAFAFVLMIKGIGIIIDCLNAMFGWSREYMLIGTILFIMGVVLGVCSYYG